MSSALINDSGKVIQPVKNKGVLDAIQQNLTSGEEIFVQVIGMSGQTLVATQKRLLIIKPGFMAGAMFGIKVSQFSYKQVSSIELKFNMITGVLEISTAGMQGTERSYWGTGKDDAYKAPNCLPISKADRKIYEKAVYIIHQLMDDATAPKADIPAANPDIPGQIRKLAELKDAGILTDAEFATKKQELLSRL